MKIAIVLYGIILLVIWHDLCKQEEDIEKIFHNQNELLELLKELKMIEEVMEQNGEKR